MDNYEKIISDYNASWKHSPLFDDEKMRYLFLSVKDEDLSSFCDYPEDFQEAKSMLEAQQKAAVTAKVDLENECFFEVIPQHQLLDWFRMRQSALERVYLEVPKPRDYEILHKAHVLTETIARQHITFGEEKGRDNYLSDCKKNKSK